MRFCYIPGGPFLKGDKFEEEDIPYNYWIGQYPVTNAHYNAFVEAGGYENKEYWSEQGWKRKIKESWVGPQHYAEPFFFANHPVVGVSWFEADAFVRWLNEQSITPKGLQFALPTASEWEKAARGGLQIPELPLAARLSMLPEGDDLIMTENPNAKRKFAWENDQPDDDLMNYSGTELGETVACGSFGRGASVYGVEELNGQVREWEETVLEEKPELEGMVEGLYLNRVLRGGAFHYFEDVCRCSYRRPLRRTRTP